MLLSIFRKSKNTVIGEQVSIYLSMGQHTGFLGEKSIVLIEFLVRFLLIIQLKAILFFQKSCINQLL